MSVAGSARRAAAAGRGLHGDSSIGPTAATRRGTAMVTRLASLAVMGLLTACTAPRLPSTSPAIAVPPVRPATWQAPESLALAAGAAAGATEAKTAALVRPGSLKTDGNILYVGDARGLTRVDLRSGAARDVLRLQAGDAASELPVAIGLSSSRFALCAPAAGTVRVVDRNTLATLFTLEGLKTPTDAIPMPDGSLIVAEMAAGSIVRASGPKLDRRDVVASGLAGPTQMVLGRDGALYLTDASGRLMRIPLDASAPLRALTSGLSAPGGLAQTPWGSFVVAEIGARRLLEIDPANGTRRTIAEDLPIGPAGSPGAATQAPTGVAVAADGSVYFTAGRSNAVYRVRGGTR